MTTLVLTIGGVGVLFIVAGILVEMGGDPGWLIEAIGVLILLVAVLILAVVGGMSLWA